MAALVEAYRSGKKFHTTVEVREFLGCRRDRVGIDQARRADLDARNELNRDPTTGKVVPAPKVPDQAGNFTRRSDGDADHDLERLMAFAKETTTKAKNLTYQAAKVSDKFPSDIDIMRFARDAARLGQESVSLKIEIDRILQNR